MISLASSTALLRLPKRPMQHWMSCVRFTKTMNASGCRKWSLTPSCSVPSRYGRERLEPYQRGINPGSEQTLPDNHNSAEKFLAAGRFWREADVDVWILDLASFRWLDLTQNFLMIDWTENPILSMC